MDSREELNGLENRNWNAELQEKQGARLQLQGGIFEVEESNPKIFFFLITLIIVVP